MQLPSHNLNKQELRKFGLITGAIVALLFGALLPWLFGGAFPLWPWLLAGVLCVWALALPASLKPVYKGWMAFGQVMGWINTRLILGIMFYLVFLPVGLVMKVLGKDPMSRSFMAEQPSYRVRREQRDKHHVEKPF
jgi:uncharacterized membrane protein